MAMTPQPPRPGQARPRRLQACALWAGLLGFAAPGFAADPVQVQVEGLAGPVLDNVREALVLPRGLVRDGQVDRAWLDRFVRQGEQRVRTALEPFGYYQPQVALAVEAAGAGRFRVRVRVVPGPPIVVATVRVTITGPGAAEAALARQAAAFPLRPGQVLLQPVYDLAKGALLASAQDLGYLKAAFATHAIRLTPAELKAELELVLATGPRFHFQDTRITGAPDYPDRFLRRYLAYRPGDPFSYTKLAEAQLNFTNSERFKEVLAVPELPETGTAVPVRVQLKPTASRSLRTGVGFGTDTGVRFSTQYRDLNLFGRGHELTPNLFLSEKLQGLALGYVLPSPTDFRDSFSAQLTLQNEKLEAYHSRMAALELARNHSFGPGTTGTAYVKLQQEQFTTALNDQTSRLVIPGVRYATDRFDNLMRPTRGYHLALELRDIFQPRQPKVFLAQVLGEGSTVVPLGGPFSLQARLRFATTFAGHAQPNDLPPSLRFFAGGSQSVRGYDYKALGPQDSLGKVVGGRHLLTASVEPEWAFLKQWGLSLFYDAGNAFDGWRPFTLHQGAGVGLHYYSAVGALNLALARQMGVEKPRYAVHFSVGYAF